MPDIMLQPGDHVAHVQVAALAGGTPGEQILFRASYGSALKLVAAYYSADTAVTGDNTNNFQLLVKNQTQAKTAFDSTYVAGRDITQWGYDAQDASATEADLEVADGDVLTLEKVEAGGGLALPAGSMAVVYRFA